LKRLNKTWPLPLLRDLLFCFPVHLPTLKSNSEVVDISRFQTQTTNKQIQVRSTTQVKMAKSGIFHHVGTFLLFVAAILLLITTISAPVVGDIAILKVTLTNKTDIRNSSVTFGTFGHCILDVAPVQ
jgi:hypothetical protein